MKLIYRWPTSIYDEDIKGYTTFETAPINTNKADLIDLIQKTDLTKRRWEDSIGLALVKQNGDIKDQLIDGFAVRPNIFLYPEYMPLRATIVRWLEHNVKQSVEWSVRTDLATSYMSWYVMSVRISIWNDYKSDSVTIGLPYCKSGGEVVWQWWGDETRENQPFRGDWVDLAKTIFAGLSKLELMGNIPPTTSLRDLFKSA
jgi:hypothetical protein